MTPIYSNQLKTSQDVFGLNGNTSFPGPTETGALDNLLALVFTVKYVHLRLDARSRTLQPLCPFPPHTTPFVLTDSLWFLTPRHRRVLPLRLFRLAFNLVSPIYAISSYFSPSTIPSPLLLPSSHALGSTNIH